MKIIFEDMFYYCFFIWNKIGECYSNIIYLNVIGSMVFVVLIIIIFKIYLIIIVVLYIFYLYVIVKMNYVLL